jgi:[acyl-carrier-protein] S-malonyltransferase
VRHPGGMAVVLHLDEAKVRAACEQAAQEKKGIVSPCNFNGGDQIVIGGESEPLARAMELCKAAGARRAMKLPVSGAFHTALMQSAADQFRVVLAATPVRQAQVPVYANVSASPVREPDEIRDALVRQLVNPVRWEETIKKLVAQGSTRFLELGAGSTLNNLIKRIAPEARTQTLGTLDEVRNFRD